MPVACPNCGSRYLRDSSPRNNQEKLSRLWFVSPLRCLDCKTRFVQQTLVWQDLKFARCPRCFRMDLAKWTGKTFEPTFWTKLRVNLGANRWRCEYCRFNFASWRKRKEVFTFKRWKQMNSAQARAEGRARVSELQLQTQREMEAKLASAPPAESAVAEFEEEEF